PQRQRKSPSCSFGTGQRPCSAPASRARASCRALLAEIGRPKEADLLPRPGSAVMGRASRNVVPLQPDLLSP
ncbi:unnamed protein product, partial [Effrenium voratum]